MSECYFVSFFVDESSDKEMNDCIGSRFIPYIDEIIEEHKKVVFLLPYGNACSKSIARTVHIVASHYPDVMVNCWSVCCNSVEGLREKMVDKLDGFYERCVLFKGFEEVPLRQGRIVRNKKMVDVSDLSLFYVEKRNGRVYNTMKYAKETGKTYIRM